MSEISGLDLGKPEKIPAKYNNIPEQPAYRVGVINYDSRQQAQVVKKQPATFSNLRDSPFTQGERNIRNYKKVDKYIRPVQPLKKNPLIPSVSFIPKTMLLSDQVAMQNPAAPDYAALRVDPMLEIPDSTISNNIYYNRNLKNTNKTLEHMLETRPMWVNDEIMNMRKLNPNAPEIVEIRQHRNTMGDAGLMNSIHKKNRITARPYKIGIPTYNPVHDIDKHRSQREKEIALGVVNQNPTSALDRISFP